MKKLKLMALSLLAMLSVNLMADVSTLTFTAKCEGSGTADDGVTWTVTSDAAESNFDNTGKGIHYGTGSAAVSYLTLTTDGLSDKTITKIVVNASGASKTTAVIGATVGENDFGTQDQALTSTAAEYTFEGSASGDIEISLTQASAKKALYVKSIAVTYSNQGSTTRTIYLNAGGNTLWDQDNAKFAIWSWKGSEEGTWSKYMVKGDDGIYSTEIPIASEKVIFGRFNSTTTSPKWGDSGVDPWNQTGNLTLPTDGKNCYTITGWGENEGFWSEYTPVEPCTPNFGIMIDEETFKEGTYNKDANQWEVLGVSLTEDQTLTLYNYCDETAFMPKNGTFKDVFDVDKVMTVTETAIYDFYIKLISGADELWVVKHSTEVLPQITEAPKSWAGEYVITAMKDENTAWVWTGIDAGQCRVEVPVADNKLTAVDPVKVIVEALQEGGYSIKVKGGTNDGKYITQKAKPDYNNALNFVDTPVRVDIEMNNGLVDIYQTVSATQKVYLLYNVQSGSSNERFRFYKDSNHGKDNYKSLTLFGTVAPAPVEAKYYVTGNEALVGKDKAWNAQAIEMVKGTYTFENLPKGEYKMKVTDGTWDHSWGYSDLSATVATEGLSTDDDNNICFTIYTPNDVTITIIEGHILGISGDFVNHCEPGYAIVVNGERKMLSLNEDQKDYTEYWIDSLALEVDDEIVLLDTCADVTFKVAVKGYEGLKPVGESDTLQVTEAAYYQFYLKLIYGGDELYVVKLEEPAEPKYFAKNNWNGAAADDWSWLEMVPSTEDNVYMLDTIVFGGIGVNINDKADDADALYFAAEEIVVLNVDLDGMPTPYIPEPRKRDTVLYAPAHSGIVLEAPKPLAGDTIKLFFDASDSKLSAFIIGRPAPAPRKEFVFVAGAVAESNPTLFAITWGKDGSNETVKLANKADDIYTAEILETVDSLVLVRCASDAAEIIWDGEGKNVWNQTANYALCDTMYFGAWVDDSNLFTITCDAPKPVCEPGYAIVVNGERKMLSLNEDQEDYTEYWIDSLELKVDDEIVLFDTCAATTFKVAVKGYEGLKPVGESDTLKVTEAAYYQFYLKLIYGADELYVVKLEEPQPECEPGYAIVVNGERHMLSLNEDQEDYTEYWIDSLELKVDDEIVLFDTCADVTFKVAVKGYEGLKPVGESDTLKVTEAAYYQFYLKLIYGADELYVVKLEEPQPECEPGYAIVVNGERHMLSLNEDQEDYTEYWIDSLELKVDDEIVLFDTCADVTFKVAVKGYEGFEPVGESDTLKVTEAAYYQFYLKLIYGADELYVVKLEEPQPECEPGYAIVVNGERKMLSLNEDQKDYTEYWIDSLELKVDDEIVLFDTCAATTFKVAVKGYEGLKPVGESDTLQVTEAAYYQFYLKLIYGGDELYVVKLEEPAEPKYFAKNNWNGAAADDWSWLELVPSTVENVYMLDTIVFGGTGVNVNDKADDADALYFAAEKIVVLNDLDGIPFPYIPEPRKRDTIPYAPAHSGIVLDAPTLLAGDTIKLFFDASDSTLSAFIIGRPAPVVTGITVNVTVPVGTPACFFYGEMSGNTFVEMDKVDDTHYTTTFANATSIGWGYLFAWEKDNWNTKNAEGDFKVEPVEGVINVEVKAWVTAPGAEYKYTTYTEWQVKFGPAWEWVNTTKQEDGFFTVEAIWGNTGINIASGENPIKQDWYPLDDPALTVAEDVVEGCNVVISLTVVDDETVALDVVKVTPIEPDPDFGLLVNGTTYLPGAPDEKATYIEYVVNTTLVVGDFVQLYDKVNKAAWTVEPEGSGFTDFEMKNNAYYIKQAGSYQFYIKIPKEGMESGLYVGFQGGGTNLNKVKAAQGQRFNILGLPVDANYRGIMIMNGQTYLQ